MLLSNAADQWYMLFWYMGSLDKYAAIADRFDMAECTIVAPSGTCCDSLPITYCRSVRHSSMSHLTGFLVVGMIDDTHIAIRMPAERGVDYYNRKDYYSVVLQVVVREDNAFHGCMRFTDV